MWGYQALCLNDGRHSTWKKNMLNICSKKDFIPIDFTHFTATDTHGSQEYIPNFSFRFRYQMIVCV